MLRSVTFVQRFGSSRNINPHVQGDHAGVLVVLHDLNLAAQYADRVLLLKAGREVATDPPEQVLQAEIIEAVYEISITVIPLPHSSCPLVVLVANNRNETTSRVSH